MSITSQNLGKIGEELVLAQYLTEGWSLITRNFQYYKSGQSGRLGEIDLILEKEEKLALVEVKTRSQMGNFGHPLEQINRQKLKFLYQTYQHFLRKNPQYQDRFVRFDAAIVLGEKVEIIPNAYNFDSFGR